MSLKLYAGYEENGYEFAIWASSQKEIAERMGVIKFHPHNKFSYQKGNKALAKEVPNRAKIWKRKLDDISEWIWHD